MCYCDLAMTVYIQTVVHELLLMLHLLVILLLYKNQMFSGRLNCVYGSLHVQGRETVSGASTLRELVQ